MVLLLSILFPESYHLKNLFKMPVPNQDHCGTSYSSGGISVVCLFFYHILTSDYGLC